LQGSMEYGISSAREIKSMERKKRCKPIIRLLATT
jgi:hypothetical protein